MLPPTGSSWRSRIITVSVVITLTVEDKQQQQQQNSKNWNSHKKGYCNHYGFFVRQQKKNKQTFYSINFSSVRPRFTDAKIKSFMVVRAGHSARFNINFEVSQQICKNSLAKVHSLHWADFDLWNFPLRPPPGLKSSGWKTDHLCLKRWPSVTQRALPSFCLLLLSAQTQASTQSS